MSKVLYYEVPGGGTFYAMHALTDSGDHQTFNFVGDDFISNFKGKTSDSDYSPTVRVDGVISGGTVIPAVSATNNLVDVTTMSAYIGGNDYTGASKVSADTDLTCVRGAGAATAFIINSIICDAAGAFSVLTGTGDTSHDLTGGRGGAGQPPYITVGSIEVAQVRFTSETAALVTADEIKMIPNVTREMAMRPGYDIEFARVSGGSLDSPGVTMRTPLAAIHTADTARRVFMECYAANFAEWQGVRDVAFQGETIGSTSSETFSGVRSFTTSEISEGSFTWEVGSLTSDPEWSVMEGKDARTWFKLLESRTATGYLVCQAAASGVPTVPASGAIAVTVTLSGGTPYLRIVG